MYINFGAGYIGGLSALNFWSNNFSISAQPSFDQKTARLKDVNFLTHIGWEIILIWLPQLVATVKTSELPGMLSVSDWCPDFWDGGDSHFILFMYITQKKMWYLCESICLHVWVMDKGNKFSPRPPCIDQRILNVTNFNSGEVCLKFMILTFSNFLFKQVWSNTPTTSPPLGDSQLLWRFENRPQIFYRIIKASK